jgi:hypothetical protein
LGVDGQTGQHEALIPWQKRKIRENMSGLVVSPKAKAVQVDDTRATAILRAIQQVLGKHEVGFRSIEQE